ncbi:MAG: bifunctional folylpolyglutamate synthase/dihydrofolate synthase [Treponemataceae bacterium]
MYQGNKGLGKKNLDTILFLAEKLGNPQKHFKCIHIAGSKGKGSTATMLANVLQKAGYRTGLFTSPHILSFFERITQAGNPFASSIYETSASEFFKIFNLIPQNEFPQGILPSWFEMVSAYSFLCFKNAKCEYVVVETGLGGRLDATNIINPEFCIITPIEHEHAEILGNTLPQIAGEKAGIIKKNIPVISAKQKKTVLKTLKNYAQRQRADFFYTASHIAIKKITINDYAMTVEFLLKKSRQKIEFHMNLLGTVQAENALTVIFTMGTFFPHISLDLVLAAIGKVKIAGRFEIVPIKSQDKTATIIFDGAHTQNSIINTIQTFKKIFKQQKSFLLFSCAGDKNAKNLARIFKKYHFQKIFVTIPGTFKKANFNQIKTEFAYIASKTRAHFYANEDFSSIIKQAIDLSIEDNAKLFVTGSFYLITEVKKVLQKMESQNEVSVL